MAKWILIAAIVLASAWWFFHRTPDVLPLDTGQVNESEYVLESLRIDGDTPLKSPLRIEAQKSHLAEGTVRLTRADGIPPAEVMVSIRGVDFAGNFTFPFKLQRKQDRYIFSGKFTTINFSGTANLEVGVSQAKPFKYYIVRVIPFETYLAGK